MAKAKRAKQPYKGKGTPEFARRMELQKARRAVDKKEGGAVTKVKNGKRVANTAAKRKGKDVSHVKALSKGGTNKDGVKLESRSTNRARNYKNKK